jgi:broad specificity phosphatase PhoE
MLQICHSFINDLKIPESQTCTFYVARPGPTADNIVENNTDKPDTTRWSSSDETALSKDGIISAKKIQEVFKNISFDKAYCSYAKRTFETAQIILSDSPVDIEPKQEFYEMNIGPTEGKTPDEIRQFFYQETGYPNRSTQKVFPKLWAKRDGQPIEPNDVFLDKWREDMDTFDAFSKEFILKLKTLAAKHLGQTLLIVPHGTPMKAIIAEAKGTTSDNVTCAKGSYYVVTVDAKGKFVLKEETQSGISIEPPPKKASLFSCLNFCTRVMNDR